WPPVMMLSVMAFGAVLVLRVDGVAVAAVGPPPAVVVDDAAVQFAVAGGAPEADALGAVVDDQADVLAVPAAVDVKAPPGARVVLRVRAGADRRGRVRLGHEDLEVPDPDVGRRVLHGQPAVDDRPLARRRSDVDRLAFGADQAHRKLLVGPAAVRAAEQVER